MLNIYINTWGNYNENGADGGEWITLPMGVEHLESTLYRIALNIEDNDPEWFVNDFEWTTEWEGRSIHENENIFELNAYVTKLDNLSEWEQLTYCAAVECWGAEYIDLDDLDEYSLYNDIENDYDLGYYWAVESGCYHIDEKNPLSNYIDYERFGRDIRFETEGGHTSFGWVERR